MCQNRVPELTAEAAAGRLAERYDVPELSAGLLDREPTREHGKFLTTTPAYAPRDLGWLYVPEIEHRPPWRSW